ncbi:anti-repressor SinI family protein [Halalkalibacter nanhaiisediminis]|uniref:Anti-repressor SinI n=1 Tax=Halalkalibacter nanhaiisediminis TaxID=688079 RepID=A0A562QN04_9BACI|nr:anti-repressor SinI family protein [Halalkalibacter nanhaiisediminis]TWI58119.1 anti-repressor SinI [Halalkalibacter nanhaiisediminis]
MIDKKEKLDYEWVNLILEAKQLGLTIEDIKDYFELGKLKTNT